MHQDPTTAATPQRSSTRSSQRVAQETDARGGRRRRLVTHRAPSTGQHAGRLPGRQRGNGWQQDGREDGPRGATDGGQRHGGHGRGRRASTRGGMVPCSCGSGWPSVDSATMATAISMTYRWCGFMRRKLVDPTCGALRLRIRCERYSGARELTPLPPECRHGRCSTRAPPPVCRSRAARRRWSSAACPRTGGTSRTGSCSTTPSLVRWPHVLGEPRGHRPVRFRREIDQLDGPHLRPRFRPPQPLGEPRIPLSPLIDRARVHAHCLGGVDHRVAVRDQREEPLEPAPP